MNTNEFIFRTEDEARHWRREFITRGFDVSLIGFDGNRNVYAFDVYSPEDEG